MEPKRTTPPSTTSDARSLIVYADDLGLCISANDGIRIAATRGYLTCTCIRVNGAAFEAAVDEVVPACPGLDVGLHLNIVEGRSTRRRIGKAERLCDADGAYRNGFAGLLRQSGNRQLLDEIEADYRDQIERALTALGTLRHINSHQHSHGIPAIFEIVCRLAKEYDIPFVRLPREKPYVIHSLATHLHAWYAANLAKIALLNTMARINKRTAARIGVRTNNWFIGIGYTGFMDARMVRAGLAAIPQDAGIVEMLMHPCAISGEPDEVFLDAAVRDYTIQPARRTELRTLCDDELFAGIQADSWRLIRYRELAGETHEDRDGDCAKRQANVSARSFDTRPSIVGRDRLADAMQLVVERGRSAEVNSIGGQSRVTHSSLCDVGSPSSSSMRPPLRALVMLDETPFHHPTFLARLFNECEHLGVVACAIVKLPHGGPLQRYMVRQWRQMGVLQFSRLGFKSVAMRAIGRLPPWIRGKREGSVRGVCQRYGIPYRIVGDVNAAPFLEYARSFEPDVIVSSCSPIFKRELLNLPNVACINRHSSLLPTFGGILPVFRAVQMGEKFTGASVHRMTPEIDGGEVLSRKWLPIFPGDTLDRLYRLCFTLSYEATNEAAAILRNEATPRSAPRAGLEKSYFSYPTREDWLAFAAAGGRFI